MNDETLRMLQQACRSLRPKNDQYEWLSSAWEGFCKAKKGVGYYRARNTVIEHIRSFTHHRSPVKVLLRSNHHLEKNKLNESLKQIDDRDFLAWLLVPLTSRDREVFVFATTMCDSQREAADHFGMSQANVNIIVNRCLQHMRKRLRDHGIDRTV